MRIIQTRGEITNGQLIANAPKEFSDGEVDVFLIAKNELDEFEVMREIAKNNGYDTQEKILELIHQLKLEMLEEKGRKK